MYDEAVAALEAEGGLVLSEEETQRLMTTHWHNGNLTGALLAKDIDVVLKRLELTHRAPENTRFLVVPSTKAGADAPISGEKMAQFFALYKAKDFQEAVKLALTIQDYQGAGHSLGLHSTKDARAHELAMAARTCRVIVNQAHCFATGGFFNNGLPFSLSMGCGSWGGNSIDGNLNWEHFVNRVRIVRVIEENKPALEDVLSEFWSASTK